MYSAKRIINPVIKLTGGGLVLLLAGCGMGMDDATD